MARKSEFSTDDRLLRLVALIGLKGLSQTEQIATLNKAGFAPKDIAELIGTTPNTVRVGLVAIRRNEHAKRGSSGSRAPSNRIEPEWTTRS